MKHPQFSKLVEVIKQLRDPVNGCPWDLRQDHQTLLKYLIEESYEYIHAVENKPEEMEEELGDVLLQVVLHAQIASESSNFDIESVSQKLADKMIRRHPHVFTKDGQSIDRDTLTDQTLQRTWDSIKASEKDDSGKKLLMNPDSFLGPALQASNKIGAKTRKYNFDWDDAGQVMYKVEEEWQELKAEMPADGDFKDKKNQAAIKEELGDLLFSVAQLARHLEIDPEECLREANNKFLNRFNQMNEFINDTGSKITDLKQNDLEDFWQQAKRSEYEKK